LHSFNYILCLFDMGMFDVLSSNHPHIQKIILYTV